MCAVALGFAWFAARVRSSTIAWAAWGTGIVVRGDRRRWSPRHARPRRSARSRPPSSGVVALARLPSPSGIVRDRKRSPRIGVALLVMWLRACGGCARLAAMSSWILHRGNGDGRAPLGGLGGCRAARAALRARRVRSAQRVSDVRGCARRGRDRARRDRRSVDRRLVRARRDVRHRGDDDRRARRSHRRVDRGPPRGCHRGARRRAVFGLRVLARRSAAPCARARGRDHRRCDRERRRAARSHARALRADASAGSRRSPRRKIALRGNDAEAALAATLHALRNATASATCRSTARLASSGRSTPSDACASTPRGTRTTSPRASARARRRRVRRAGVDAARRGPRRGRGAPAGSARRSRNG